jgi:hypothetical protein
MPLDTGNNQKPYIN